MLKLSIGRRNFDGVAYSEDSRVLVTLNSRTQLRFWDLRTFKERFRCRLARYGEDPHSFVFHGSLLALRTRVWDCGVILRRVQEGGIAENSVGPVVVDLDARPRYVTTNGRLIAAATDFQPWPPGGFARIRIWDEHGQAQGQTDAGRETEGYPAPNLALASDGRQLAVSVLNWRNSPAPFVVLVYDLAANAQRHRLVHSSRVDAVRFSSDGNLIASAAGRSVWLWNLKEGLFLQRFPAFRKYVEAIAFHPHGRLLAAGSRDGEVRIWDIPSLRQVASFDWEIGAIHGLAFSPDGMTAAAAGHNGAVVIWDLD